MPKFLLLVLILFGFLFALSSSAQTPTPDLQSIIKQLQEQIKLLNQQILDLQSRLEKTEEEVQTVKAELKLTRTLRKGESNDEVRQLQEFLSRFPDIYPEGKVTGFFGSLTETAVKRFQEKHGIESIGIVGPKTLQRLNEFSVSAIPAIPAIPAVPGVFPAVPATPASFSLLFRPASASQSIVPAIPAIPAIPAVPGVSTAIPAIPAQPSSSTSTPIPSISVSPSPTASTSATKTPTPTPTPTPTLSSTATLDLGIVGFSGLSSSYQANASFQVNIMPYNYTCRFCQHTSPPTTVKGYYVSPLNYPNGSPRYGEQIISVPSIPQWQSVIVTWQGVASAPPGRYYFVAFIDPDNALPEANENNNYLGSEFFIQSSVTASNKPATVDIEAIDGTWCYDSDRNNDQKIKGSCQDNAGTYYDYCSGGIVYEYVCRGFSSTTVGCAGGADIGKNYICSDLFGASYTCSAGACVNMPTSTPTPTPTPAPTGSVSFSPLDSSQISAMANILNALKTILQTLTNLIP